MLSHFSDGCLAATLEPRADRSPARLLRWAILGAISLIAFLFAISHAASVGAAAPTTHDGTICINFFTCYNTGTGAAVSNTTAVSNTNSGYPPNTVISTYFDPRYGIVSVVTDASGNLIDINASTGQRIYPVFSDFGFGFGAGFVGPSFINSNFAFNGTFPNFFGNNGCPVGNFSCLNNGCPVGNFSCLTNGTFPNFFGNNGCPAGNFSCLGFNPFFGFPFGTGNFTGNVAVVAPNGNPIVVGPPFRVKEVAAPTVATTVAPAASASAPAAPAANYATALNTSSAPATVPASDSGVHVFSAPAVTAPAATTDADDHRG